MSKQWQSSSTQVTTAKPGAIWQHWIDVSSWPEEDKNLKEASIRGDFKVGSKITMWPTAGPKSTVTIAEVTPNKTFATEGNIPFGKLIISHKIESTDDGKTCFTHTMTVTGPLRRLFVKMFVQKLADDLPEKMQKIADIAEAS